MDFRLVPTTDVRWTTGARGQPMARTARGDKVVVQTPLCPCRVSLARPGMYRLDLALPNLPTHAAFRDWLSALEDGVTDTPETATWRGPRGRSTCVFNNSMRLMAFSDTLAFDESGKLSADLLSAAGCSCIIELQGAWTTDTRWGLRWKVVQIKFSSEPPALPQAAPRFVQDEDDDPPGAGAASFAFLHDV